MSCREDILYAVAAIWTRSADGTLGVMDVVMEMQWGGTMTSADFVVTLPTDVQPGLRVGTVTISVKGMRVSRMAFQLHVVDSSEQRASGGRATSSRHERAFASYASEDRDRVLARVQGMEAVMPMQVFVDVDTLRSSGGIWEDQLRDKTDDANVMPLFWSKAAEASRWVNWEWRYALERHGLGFIEPMPLEPPAVVALRPSCRRFTSTASGWPSCGTRHSADVGWPAFMCEHALVCSTPTERLEARAGSAETGMRGRRRGEAPRPLGRTCREAA